MFKPIDQTPPDVVALEAMGTIVDADYKDVLVPAIEATLRAHGKAKVLLHFGRSFKGYSAHAVLDDALLGLTHWNDFQRLAVVTDIGWIASGVRLFSPFMRAPARVFANAELQAALDWIGRDPDIPEQEV